MEIEVGCEPGSSVDDLLDAGAGASGLTGDRLELRLDGYGHRWFRVREPSGRMVP